VTINLALSATEAAALKQCIDSDLRARGYEALAGAYRLAFLLEQAISAAEAPSEGVETDS
jgi:hypothetical protein